MIYVYDSFSKDITQFMGILYIDVVRGKESYSFEYDDNWLSIHPNIHIDPRIEPYSGRQYIDGGGIFGIFADASPDRWGRTLMNKREKIIADREERKPARLLDSDYLLGVYDASRMGGIRLKNNPDGEFLSCDEENPIPVWTTLRRLEHLSEQYEDDKLEWVEQLIRPGSSLGGARPKATVMDEKGELWIAKFPSKHDDNNVGAWEKVAYDLAQKCGITVKESRLEKFSERGSTFLVKRFDRAGEKRIHFASAMTLLNKTDGASAADGTGYQDIASFIRSNGSNPKKDLQELWRRIVFNMAISNTDDHLRNHAFILDKNGWHLSPMYDVNPMPYGNELSLNVSENDNSISFELAIEESRLYGIEKDEATNIVGLIQETVKNNWQKIASQYGISKAKIEDMRPAFDECNKEI